MRKTSPRSETSTRLELRVDSERAAVIAAAAAITHQSVAAFVLDAASAHARQVLDRSSATELDAQCFDRVLEALDASYEPSPALQRAATPATIVELLGTDEGREIEFEPGRLGLTGRIPDP